MKRTKYPTKIIAFKYGATTLQDTDIIPFGKYHDQGVQMANIPAWYLLNLYDSGKCFGAIKMYIEENLDCLRKEK